MFLLLIGQSILCGQKVMCIALDVVIMEKKLIVYVLPSTLQLQGELEGTKMGQLQYGVEFYYSLSIFCRFIANMDVKSSSGNY